MYKIVTLWLPIISCALWSIGIVILIYYNNNAKFYSLIALLVTTATTYLTVASGLRPKVIEKSIATAIVMDEVSHFPLSDTDFRTALGKRMVKLNSLASPSRQGANIVKRPQNFDETISFLGELLQYAILNELCEMSRDIEVHTTEVGPDGAFANYRVQSPIYPPKKEEYYKEDLYTMAKSNRFFDGDNEGQKCKLPLFLPKGTTIRLLPSDSGREYEMYIEKPQFFEIQFVVKFASASSEGVIPRDFKVYNNGVNARVYFFRIDGKAILSAITGDNPDRESYEKWIENIFEKISRDYDN